MLNLEILKLTEQKKYLKDEINSIEEMHQVATREKNSLQSSNQKYQVKSYIPWKWNNFDFSGRFGTREKVQWRTQIKSWWK